MLEVDKLIYHMRCISTPNVKHTPLKRNTLMLQTMKNHLNHWYVYMKMK